MAESAALLVDEVLPKKPIRQWVLTVPFPLRFLFAAYPELMSKVLGIVTRAVSTHLVHQAGFKKKDAHTGAVTLIQRFGSALNLNIHSDVHGRTNVAGAWMRRSDHMLFLDGVYVLDGVGGFAFHCNKAPTVEQLTELLHTISQRVASFLEGRGLLERDEDNSYLTLNGLDEDPMQELHSHSVTYRIAMGPQRGRKVFTLQTIPPKSDLPPDSCHASQTWQEPKRARDTSLGRENASRAARIDDLDAKFGTCVQYRYREVCEKCQGPVKIIACVEDTAVIDKILKHLKEKAVSDNTVQLPPGRAPPQIELFEGS